MVGGGEDGEGDGDGAVKGAAEVALEWADDNGITFDHAKTEP